MRLHRAKDEPARADSADLDRRVNIVEVRLDGVERSLRHLGWWLRLGAAAALVVWLLLRFAK